MAPNLKNAPRGVKILRRKQVEARVGLACSTIYAKLTKNPKRPGDFDPTFPRPIPLGGRAVGWLESEIEAWILAQMERSRSISEPAWTPTARAGRRARKCGKSE